MTKDEIKKALECCEKYAYCEDCPCYTYCGHELHKDALALITEQEKEIDFQVQDRARLQREIDELEQAHEQRVEEIKRLKAEVKQAQIDVLNEAKEKLDSAPNGWAYTGYIDDLIEEVQNAKSKGTN